MNNKSYKKDSRDINKNSIESKNKNRKKEEKWEHSWESWDDEVSFETSQDGSFESFGLKDSVLRGVKEAGFLEPSPIQKEAIPVVLGGSDLIAQAQTGTGKTAAFALPILNSLSKNGDIEALVITPTRELCVQVSDEIFKLGRFIRAKTISFYGGQPIKRQLELLKKNPQVAIATPGRLLDLLSKNKIPNFNPKIIVLDESDEMLDMGFLDDVEEIFRYLPEQRQSLLFSATMPIQIKYLAQRILNCPKIIKITSEETTSTDVSQRYYIIEENEREAAIMRLIDTESPNKAIIFVRQKREADTLCAALVAKGYSAVALHGDMDQRERIRSIKAFKGGAALKALNESLNGAKNRADSMKSSKKSIESKNQKNSKKAQEQTKEASILVATDIAARGLDISGVSHVFNYHIPLNPESYVHRIGRTGRAGKKGVAITLATPLEFKELRRIRDNTGAKIELYEVPNEMDDSPDSALLEKILHYEISDKALAIYEQIKSSADLAQLVCKLLSMLLAQSPAKRGSIGKSREELKALAEQLEENPQKGRKPRRRSRR